MSPRDAFLESAETIIRQIQNTHDQIPRALLDELQDQFHDLAPDTDLYDQLEYLFLVLTSLDPYGPPYTDRENAADVYRDVLFQLRERESVE